MILLRRLKHTVPKHKPGGNLSKCTQTCASLSIDRRHHLATVSRLPRCGEGWLSGGILMQGGAHLGGHASGPRCAVVGGTQGAELAASWRRGVRNDGVEGSSGAAGWSGH